MGVSGLVGVAAALLAAALGNGGTILEDLRLPVARPGAD